MNQLRKTLLLALIFACVVPVFAETQKILLVDMEKVLAESIAGKAAKNNFDEELKKRQLVIDKGKSDFEKMKGEFEKQAAVLSGEALNEKREALTKKEKELARLFQDQREELGKKNQAELGKILKQVRGVVDSVAASQNADLVLEKDARNVLYARAGIDITADVIKQLDSKITK